MIDVLWCMLIPGYIEYYWSTEAYEDYQFYLVLLKCCFKNRNFLFTTIPWLPSVVQPLEHDKNVQSKINGSMRVHNHCSAFCTFFTFLYKPKYSWLYRNRNPICVHSRCHEPAPTFSLHATLSSLCPRVNGLDICFCNYVRTTSANRKLPHSLVGFDTVNYSDRDNLGTRIYYPPKQQKFATA